MSEQMSERFVFCLDGSGYVPMYRSMLADIQERQDVFIVDAPYLRSDKVLRGKSFTQWKDSFEKRFSHFDPTIPWCSLNKVLKGFARNQPFYLVLFNSSLRKGYSPVYLRWLRRRFPKMRLILFFVDQVASNVSEKAMHIYKSGLADFAYTVDRADAEKYGIAFTWQMFPSDFFREKEKEQFALYYCAFATHNRIEQISEAALACSAAGVLFCFDLVYKNDTLSSKVTELAGIHRVPRIQPYQTVLAQVKKAHCILDITQPGQTALTLRPYEAVCAGKRLLTNNPAITKFPYYDARYMRVFDKITQEDVAWAIQPEQPEYRYNGEFSARHFLQRLQEDAACLNR